MQLIRIDYSASVSDLFTEVAFALIESLPFFSLLGMGTLLPSTYEEALPSCDPDLASNDFGRYWIASKAHRAGVKEDTRSLREVKGRQLVLCGHLLDTVVMANTEYTIFDVITLLSVVERSSAMQPDLVASYDRTRYQSEMNAEIEKLMLRMRVLDGLREFSRDPHGEQCREFRSALDRLRSLGHDLPSQQDLEDCSAQRSTHDAGHGKCDDVGVRAVG